ncbi:hypothetical protein FA95DRAFT_663892 [Auriscalpium vulgare]|uniref:Uncharacterized protein n=1 Tax=Auriscalpium vulgare TaxID=40419 RepID=A0ACB8S325_9AGAM|nr:hypothetical protein FA95DRAFT_663892 [Auriscalpium vulgare]
MGRQVPLRVGVAWGWTEDAGGRVRGWDAGRWTGMLGGGHARVSLFSLAGCLGLGPSFTTTLPAVDGHAYMARGRRGGGWPADLAAPGGVRGWESRGGRLGRRVAGRWGGGMEGASGGRLRADYGLRYVVLLSVRWLTLDSNSLDGWTGAELAGPHLVRRTLSNRLHRQDTPRCANAVEAWRAGQLVSWSLERLARRLWACSACRHYSETPMGRQQGQHRAEMRRTRSCIARVVKELHEEVYSRPIYPGRPDHVVAVGWQPGRDVRKAFRRGLNGRAAADGDVHYMCASSVLATWRG